MNLWLSLNWFSSLNKLVMVEKILLHLIEQWEIWKLKKKHFITKNIGKLFDFWVQFYYHLFIINTQVKIIFQAIFYICAF